MFPHPHRNVLAWWYSISSIQCASVKWCNILKIRLLQYNRLYVYNDQLHRMRRMRNITQIRLLTNYISSAACASAHMIKFNIFRNHYVAFLLVI